MSEHHFDPENIRNKVLFDVDENWTPDVLTYHHEPRLARESHELVNQAIEVRQDDCEALDSASSEDFLKSPGIGPCILLSASARERQQLGAVHFDAGSDIRLLMDKLYRKLGVENLDGFSTRLIGGIEGMPGSESLRSDLKLFFEDHNVKIDADNTMRLRKSDYDGLFTEDHVLMFAYQSVIINKKTGEVLSFDQFLVNSKKNKKASISIKISKLQRPHSNSRPID